MQVFYGHVEASCYTDTVGNVLGSLQIFSFRYSKPVLQTQACDKVMVTSTHQNPCTITLLASIFQFSPNDDKFAVLKSKKFRNIFLMHFIEPLVK